MKIFSNKKYGISLKLFVALAIILVSIISVGIYAVICKKIYYSQYEDNIINDVGRYTEIIAKLSADYKYDNDDSKAVNDTDVKLDSMIEILNTVYGGKIIIIDSDYRIIKSSDKQIEGMFIIGEEIIEAMNQSDTELSENNGNYIQYIRQIKKDGKKAGLILVDISTDNLNKISDAAMSRMLVVLLFIVVICIIVSYYLSSFGVRDLRYINNQMDIIQNGHLDETIKERGFSEFRRFIENYNETIEKLADIDSSRQEFVSNVSHELKTPITSMKVLADSLVQNEDADLNMYKEFMSDIVDEIDRESKIISDLLMLVKMDKKSAQINIEEVDINNLVEIILKRVTPIAEQRNIEITYESYRDVVAEVDEVKLSLALSNIIENAVKYNVDNGWIKVTLNADHKFFYIKVADSGVGIPDDCKSQVFERFYRVDKARSRNTGGTGLGLAITKNVITLHNGTIKLYSEWGEGTTFTIKIPLKRG